MKSKPRSSRRWRRIKFPDTKRELEKLGGDRRGAPELTESSAKNVPFIARKDSIENEPEQLSWRMPMPDRSMVCISITLIAFSGCLKPAAPATVSPVAKPFRLALCTEAPVRLAASPSDTQPRGCVVNFIQEWSDPDSIRWLGARQALRRYLVYAPPHLPAGPLPVVFVFPGSTASAEAAALYYTHSRFEALADRDGFIVVYGNGLPNPVWPGDKPSSPKGGFLPGCRAQHAGEGLDVTYVRLIVAQLETELKIDCTRIYATGLSMGGGMSLQLALEAPDSVAAVAPVAPVPFQPSGEWLQSCHPRPGYETVSIAMLAATADPFISYAPARRPSTRKHASRGWNRRATPGCRP